MKKKANCDDSSAISRLYIIKSALNLSAASKGGLSSNAQLAAAHSKALDFNSCINTAVSYPCEVIAYLERYGDKLFPEGGTTTITLNSNAYIYGAYHELGRYYASHLELNVEPGGAALSLKDGWTPDGHE